jgi:2,3-bisphosphoglycerate-dependent phosphoglycerate mutase
LVLVRHGQSEFNLRNVFTGWRDPGLSPRGVEEAHAAGRRLRALGITFGAAFTSGLVRAKATSRIVLDELGLPDMEPAVHAALNERDYGELSGLDKDEVRRRWGEAQVRIWRRSYDVAPPGGESLRDTLARALPYYMREILPSVMRGVGCLVSTHGNTIRALVMALEGLSPGAVEHVEIATGEILIYRLRQDTGIASKQTLPGALGVALPAAGPEPIRMRS